MTGINASLIFVTTASLQTCNIQQNPPVWQGADLNVLAGGSKQWAKYVVF